MKTTFAIALFVVALSFCKLTSMLPGGQTDSPRSDASNSNSTTSRSTAAKPVKRDACSLLTKAMRIERKLLSFGVR